jgi:hypothetical protein
MTPNPVGVLLVDLATRGVELRAEGSRLRFRPRSAVTPDLAGRLKTHKAQMLAILQGAEGPAAEAEAFIQHVRSGGDNDLAEALAEAWQERLSIGTADGGLTLAEAAAVALEQLRSMLT